ncbi:MAG: hypothetical protein HYZ75_16585, partial [Elusimicrobia bacterium]|nr:hypothetical protein [Elusimicrobiota bacterium]
MRTSASLLLLSLLVPVPAAAEVPKAAACLAGPAYAAGFSPAARQAAREFECLRVGLRPDGSPAVRADVETDRLAVLIAAVLRELPSGPERAALEERLVQAAADLRGGRDKKEPKRLRSASAERLLAAPELSPESLALLYDNGGGAADLPEVLAEPGTGDEPATGAQPKSNLAFPSPPPTPEAEPGETEEGLIDRLSSVFELVTEPFANLTAAGRRRYFLKKREAWRAVLERDPLEVPPARLALYQLFMQEALAKGAVPSGMRVEPWELGTRAAGAASAVVAAETEGAASFTGLTLEYADGSSRFEGSAGQESLVVSRMPADGREVRTRVFYGKDGAKGRTETTVIDTRAKKTIHKELVDLAQALSTRIFFEDGVETRRVTINSDTGVRLVSDRRAGMEAVRQPDGRTVITAGDPSATGWVTQQGTVDESGFRLERIALQNGNAAVAVSPSVFKIVGPGETPLGYELSVERLAADVRGGPRDALAAALAKEAVKELGLDDSDGRYSRPLGNFLYDMRSKDEYFKDVKLYFNASGEFLLKYTYADGQRRYEQARFGDATPFEGQTRVHRALIVYRPQHLPSGDASPPQESSIRFNEYLDTGGYNHWHSMFGTEIPEWYEILWKDPLAVETISLQRWRWAGDLDTGTWSMSGSQLWKVDKRPASIPAAPSSGLAKAAGDAFSSLARMAQAAPSELIYQLGGGDDFRAYSAQTYAKAPAMTYLLDADEFWVRVPVSQRPAVRARAQRYRADGLRYYGFFPGKTDARVYWHMLAYPYSMAELFDALRENFDKEHAGRVVFEVQKTLAFAESDVPGRAAMDLGPGAAVALDPMAFAKLGIDAGSPALRPFSGGGMMDALPAALQAAGLTHRILGGGLFGDWAAAQAGGLSAGGSPASGSGSAEPGGDDTDGGPGETPAGSKPPGTEAAPRADLIAALGQALREGPTPGIVADADRAVKAMRKDLVDRARAAAAEDKPPVQLPPVGLPQGIRPVGGAPAAGLPQGLQTGGSPSEPARTESLPAGLLAFSPHGSAGFQRASVERTPSASPAQAIGKPAPTQARADVPAPAVPPQLAAGASAAPAAASASAAVAQTVRSLRMAGTSVQGAGPHDPPANPAVQTVHVDSPASAAIAAARTPVVARDAHPQAAAAAQAAPSFLALIRPAVTQAAQAFPQTAAISRIVDFMRRPEPLAAGSALTGTAPASSLAQAP